MLEMLKSQGSPPHTWRIQGGDLSNTYMSRITSTYVENTKSWSWISLRTWGSPPHTWRIHNYSEDALREIRITSTYVENTYLISASHWLFQDHLHIRGEYTKARCLTVLAIGSPPHTWRIQVFCLDLPFCGRITSTYVENTARRDHRRYS